MSAVGRTFWAVTRLCRGCGDVSRSSVVKWVRVASTDFAALASWLIVLCLFSVMAACGSSVQSESGSSAVALTAAASSTSVPLPPSGSAGTPSVLPAATASAVPKQQSPQLTGVPVLDRFLTAYFGGDVDELVAQSVLTPVACIGASGIGRGCEAGESAGSVRDMFFYGGGCGPGWVSPEGLDTMWAGAPNGATFWAVARQLDGYLVIVLVDSQYGPLPVVFSISTRGVTGIGNTCLTPAEVAFPPGTDFLVPPK
jgi:hypothetical protein